VATQASSPPSRIKLTARSGTQRRCQDRSVTNDLDTLLTALYVKIDDELEADRWMGRPRS
jgi:hypothetical protein